MVAALSELPRPDPAVEELVGSVHGILQSVLHRIHPALEAERISMGQFWALHFVASLGSKGLSTVARYLALSAPSVCAKVDELEAAGLVVRHRAERDRRIVELRLTPKGRKVEARLWEEIATVVGRAADDVPRDDLATAVRVFQDLRARLDGATVPPRSGA
jgi:DNA-binding MarR family transcriptional regulator